MTEVKPRSSPSSASSSNGNQVSDSAPLDLAAAKSGPPLLARTTSRPARHEDIAYFSPDGDLQRSVSRQQVRQISL